MHGSLEKLFKNLITMVNQGPTVIPTNIYRRFRQSTKMLNQTNEIIHSPYLQIWAYKKKRIN